MVTFTGSDRSLRGTLLWQAILSIPTGLLLFLALLHFGEQWLTPAGIIGGAAMTASALITSLSSGMVQRSGRMIGAFQKVRLMPQACGALSFVLLWVVGNRDPNFWILASGVAFLAPCVILFIEQLGGMASIVRIRNVRPPPGFVRIAAGALAFAMGSQVIYRLDGVLVAIYLPTPQVAMYAVAVTAAGAVAAVGQSVGMTTFSRLRGISDSSLRRRLVRNGIIQTACITMALAIPIAITAPLIIRLLYGPDFEPAVAATRILVLAAVPLALDYLLSHALIGMRATSSVVRVQSLAIVGTTILLCLAIASASIEMVASVSLLVYSFSSALLSAVAYRRTRSDH